MEDRSLLYTIGRQTSKWDVVFHENEKSYELNLRWAFTLTILLFKIEVKFFKIQPKIIRCL